MFPLGCANGPSDRIEGATVPLGRAGRSRLLPGVLPVLGGPALPATLPETPSALTGLCAFLPSPWAPLPTFPLEAGVLGLQSCPWGCFFQVSLPPRPGAPRPRARLQSACTSGEQVSRLENLVP